MGPFWQGVAHVLSAREHAGFTVVVPKSLYAPHPEHSGAIRSIGLPKGQAADYRFPPDAMGRGLHVQEYRDHWKVHLDTRHPDVDPLGHIVSDVLGMGGGKAGG